MPAIHEWVKPIELKICNIYKTAFVHFKIKNALPRTSQTKQDADGSTLGLGGCRVACWERLEDDSQVAIDEAREEQHKPGCMKDELVEATQQHQASTCVKPSHIMYEGIQTLKT